MGLFEDLFTGFCTLCFPLGDLFLGLVSKFRKRFGRNSTMDVRFIDRKKLRVGFGFYIYLLFLPQHLSYGMQGEDRKGNEVLGLCVT